MKKYFYTLFIFSVLIMSITACKKSEDNTSTNKDETPDETIIDEEGIDQNDASS